MMCLCFSEQPALSRHRPYARQTIIPADPTAKRGAENSIRSQVASLHQRCLFPYRRSPQLIAGGLCTSVLLKWEGENSNSHWSSLCLAY